MIGKFLRLLILSLPIFLVWTDPSLAQTPPSEYSFAVTNQYTIGTEYGKVGFLMNEAESYLAILQGPRALNIAILCVVCALFAYLYNMKPAALAFGTMTVLTVMANRPYLGLAIFLPIIIYKQVKMVKSDRRMDAYHGGLNLIRDRSKADKDKSKAEIKETPKEEMRERSNSSTKIARPI